MLEIANARYKINDSNVFSIDFLSLELGKSYAFIGRNASGKSILAKALAGEQRLLSGKVINQFKRPALLSFEKLQQLIEDEWQRNNTDLVNEDDSGLTVSQVILGDSQNINHCQLLAEQFNIKHLLNQQFSALSTGETRKTLICQSLMKQPDLLILDEPFDGLDKESCAYLAKQLSQMISINITLVLILNRFNEIPEMVDYVGIIADCQIIKMDKKDTIITHETIKQLSDLEKHTHMALPESDQTIQILAQEIDRILLNNGYVYYNDKAIINGLTWRVKANENWQIIGPNGAGKSTLLNLITGDHPQGYSNDLTLFGRKRGSGETIWDIKRHIGYVSSSFHQNYRVNTSVINVIISGYFDSIGVYQPISDKQKQLAYQWLSLLGFEHLAQKPFQSLSWGSQRLLLIARALVKHPTLLILDEPLQGLDQLNRELVKRWIDHLISEGHSQLIFVSHHSEDAPKCINNCLTFIPINDHNYQYIINHKL